MMIYFSAIGQDSHRFSDENGRIDDVRPLMLGGILISGHPGLSGNSDADVVLHALANAISGLSCQPVLGAVADEMCRRGITDSSAYVKRALETLGESIRLTHLSFSIEAQRPRLSEYIVPMRGRIAEITGLSPDHVAITAISGEGLTAFGQGLGMSCFCIASAVMDASASPSESACL